MGELKDVWTGLPDTDEETTFKEEFRRHFGRGWDEVMLGAEKPFDHHRYWDGYFAVTGLASSRGHTLLDVTAPGRDGIKPLCYNVIVP